jgi:hypothetical protein
LLIRKEKIMFRLDNERIRELYLLKMQPSRYIGKLFGVTYATIINRLRDMGIERRPRGGSNHHVPKIKISQSEYRKYTRDQLCEIYNATRYQVEQAIGKYPKKKPRKNKEVRL